MNDCGWVSGIMERTTLCNFSRVVIYYFAVTLA